MDLASILPKLLKVLTLSSMLGRTSVRFRTLEKPGGGGIAISLFSLLALAAVLVAQPSGGPDAD